MFALRVDIDSRYGLLHGVPNLLDALRKHDARASFYIPMGGESTPMELLQYRGGQRGAMGGVKLPKAELLRMTLLPRNFAQENAAMLSDLMAQDHTLGVHGYKHRAWTRALDRIDVQRHVLLATAKYTELFGRRPASFASPAFNANESVLKALDSNGYAVASDLDGRAAFRPVVNGTAYGCVQVPITLKMPNTDPLIEAFSLQGLSDDAVAERVCGMIDGIEAEGGLATLYCHDFFEGVHKPHIISAILAHVKKQGYEESTLEAIGRETTAKRNVVF